MNKDQHILERNRVDNMLNMRISGLSLTSLAYLFGVSYQAVIWHLRKYRIENPQEIYDIQRITRKVIPPPKEDIWIVIEGEKINKGKSYSEYIQESKKRAFR